MRRREFLALLAGAAAIQPSASMAQRLKVPTIGVLVVGSPASERFWRLFQQDMRELGYIEGRNVQYQFRSDMGQAGRLPALAEELVRLQVDLIVVWFTPAALAARQATHEIPIVMALVGNPVETGLVATLAKPGGNVTGMAAIGAELAGKLVDVIRQLMPGVRRIAALANVTDPFSKPFLREIESNGAAAGLMIDPVMIPSSTELDASFSALDKEPPDALIIQPSLPIRRVAELAVHYRLPAVSFVRDFADQGGLLSYGSDEADAYRKAATYVDEILKGAKAANLPVQQPTKFQFVVNLRTAKALGLTVPQSMLSRADEVIE
ncbi:ABC transporter substrate-binding protein [Bradyrhizobium liaoningense]|uniref:ABC transporter substrate-binding protein n=1 Tax=Bradyrhizobium liaoningense TaxID=43992 RepID=UPI001BA475BA|nr:ABC transporter substrate-binding protein [Bradyrhizobium liaoningense]MBR0714856.1 ABC transporter substrate-binding protein [Bradyrhizobium liaoningense]